MAVIFAGSAVISYRSSRAGAVVEAEGRGYRPKRPPLKEPRPGGGVEEGAEGCSGASGRLG